MKEYYINCLCDYLIALERLKNRYFVHGNPSAVSILYRGLPDKDYKLLPSLFRKQTDWCNYEEDNPEYITNSAYLEYGTEVGILRAFIHEASRFVDLPSDELEKWAEYAQHYGAPTRLLDWTSNPLVALYFACKYVPKDDKKSKTKISDKTFGKDGKVWMLHVKNYDHIRYGRQPRGFRDLNKREALTELINGKEEQLYPIVYTPYYVDERMSAQSSFFMGWGSIKKPIEEMFSDEKYQMVLPEEDSAERAFGKHEEEALLFCFFIHADRKPFLLRELDIVGINEKTLFPGLDGIGRYVEQRFRFNYNESVSSI